MLLTLAGSRQGRQKRIDVQPVAVILIVIEKQNMDKNKEAGTRKEDKELKPDRETLHTPDPQENMQGPVSSPMKETGEAFDSNESQKHADERRAERM